jgi:hypothetical protein
LDCTQHLGFAADKRIDLTFFCFLVQVHAIRGERFAALLHHAFAVFAFLGAADWTRLRGAGARTAINTYAVFLDREGRLLVGALDGLFRRQGDRLVPVTLGRGPESGLRAPG